MVNGLDHGYLARKDLVVRLVKHACNICLNTNMWPEVSAEPKTDYRGRISQAIANKARQDMGIQLNPKQRAALLLSVGEYYDLSVKFRGDMGLFEFNHMDHEIQRNMIERIWGKT